MLTSKDGGYAVFLNITNPFTTASEREVKLASLQLHRSRHLHAQRVTISAKEKAMYLEGAEAKEALLLQRLHDLALRRCLLDY